MQVDYESCASLSFLLCPDLQSGDSQDAISLRLFCYEYITENIRCQVLDRGMSFGSSGLRYGGRLLPENAREDTLLFLKKAQQGKITAVVFLLKTHLTSSVAISLLSVLS